MGCPVAGPSHTILGTGVPKIARTQWFPLWNARTVEGQGQMRRRSLLLLVLLVLPGLPVAWIFSHPDPRVRAYTVQEVLAGVRSRPDAWLGRTLLIRGYLVDQPAYCAPPVCRGPAWSAPPPVHPPGAYAEWEELHAAGGEGRVLFASPTLVLQRSTARVSTRSSRLHDLLGWSPVFGTALANALFPLSAAARTPRWGALATYRITLLPGARCSPTQVFAVVGSCGPQGIRR